MPTYNETASGGALGTGLGSSSQVVKVNIYPHKFPQSGNLPAVVYNLVSNPHSLNLDGSAGHSLATVQFDLLCGSQKHKLLVSSAMMQLLNQVTNLLFGAVPVMYSRLQNHRDGDVWRKDGSDKVLWVKQCDFQIRYRESKPPLKFAFGTTTEDIGESLVTYLGDLAPVYPGKAPQKHTGLAIIYNRATAGNQEHLTGRTNCDDPVLVLSLRGERYRDVLYLGKNIRERLNGLQGQIANSKVFSVVLADETDMSELRAGSDNQTWNLDQSYHIVFDEKE